MQGELQPVPSGRTSASGLSQLEHLRCTHSVMHIWLKPRAQVTSSWQWEKFIDRNSEDRGSDVVLHVSMN